MEPELKKLVIEKTVTSPYIEFDGEKRELVMMGRSRDENAHEFFVPLFVWLEKFLKSNPDQITLNVSFEYMATSAGKQLFELIKLLRKSETIGNSITVNWYYEEEDEDMEQMGVDFSNLLEMKFNFGIWDN